MLPWAPKTGWVLCDIYFQNGKPVPFSTRHLYRNVLRALADAGFDYMAGLEVEFHVFKLENPRLDPDRRRPGRREAPQVSLLSPGYQYLTETRFDQIEPILETSAATWSRSICRCARSRSSLGRASASSPSIRRWGLRPPTP